MLKPENHYLSICVSSIFIKSRSARIIWIVLQKVAIEHVN